MASPGDLEVIRLALMRELETINAYQQLHDRAQGEELKVLLQHLLGEEKEHVAELTAILRRFDAQQDAHFVSGHGAQAGGPDPRAAPRLPSSAAPGPTGLTVGSLLGHP